MMLPAKAGRRKERTVENKFLAMEDWMEKSEIGHWLVDEAIRATAASPVAWYPTEAVFTISIIATPCRCRITRRCPRTSA